MDNPLSLNRYTYTHNNPLRFVDPSGHRPLEYAQGTSERVNSAGLKFEDASLYWAKKTVEWADATGAVPFDVVQDVVPAEYVEEVKTIVGLVGAPKWQREAGDVPNLGLGAPVAAVTIKNTGKSTLLLNQATKVADHHIFPKFRGNDKYAKFFKAKGINVDDFTVTLSHGKGSHHLKFIHGQGKWNETWKAWIDANPNATAKEIFQQAGKMMDEYGLSGIRIHPYKK